MENTNVNTKTYILVYSNGIKIKNTVCATKEQAVSLLKKAVSEHLRGVKIEDFEFGSYVSDHGAYLCPLDVNINEDWVFEILEI